jgi:pimeloyl-ACP methyl ester carboxylesterase
MNSENESGNAARNVTRKVWRVTLGILGAMVAVAAALGMVIWRAPLWVEVKLTEFQLSHSGIYGHAMMIDGLRVHYLEGGGGPPVVLVHGLGSHAQQDWSRLLPPLVQAGYHVYAMDLIGYGRSDKPSNWNYSISEEAKFVEAFMDAKQLPTVELAGVSMGGWIAATVALQQPQRITRLALFDSAGMTFKLSFDPIVFTPDTTEQVDRLFAVVTNTPQKMPTFVKEDFIRKSQRNGWVVKRALASMMTGTDVLDRRFSDLKMPLLIVWGKEDTLTPVAVGEAMHRAAPQSELAVYDGCGHIAVVTCVERIAPTVVEFLGGGGRAGDAVEVTAERGGDRR